MTEKRKRAQDVTETLRSQIAAGALAPGVKLMSEQALCKQFEVSRTVVREAVSALALEGLIYTRHGVGSFVAATKERSFSALQPLFSSGVHEALNVLELRIAVEIESAGLAASRRTSLQEEDIHQQHIAFTLAIERGQQTVAEDFAFHRAIAMATNNPVYVEVLDNLGQRSIPRTLLKDDADTISLAYQSMLRDEHDAIMSAITEGDAERARQAMRQHLVASQKRYRHLRSQAALLS